MRRIMHHWPHLVILFGLVLFWLTSWFGERLPAEALFAGPGLMLAGIIMRSQARSK